MAEASHRGARIFTTQLVLVLGAAEHSEHEPYSGQIWTHWERMKAEVANERTDVVDASEIVLDWYLAILAFGGGKISFLLRDFRSASSLDQDAFRGWWDWRHCADAGVGISSRKWDVTAENRACGTVTRLPGKDLQSPSN